MTWIDDDPIAENDLERWNNLGKGIKSFTDDMRELLDEMKKILDSTKD